MSVECSYPWTRLWVPQQQAAFQESTPFILVYTDTPVGSTATSCFPRVYTFHSRIHGHSCWFHSNELLSKSLHLSFSYPWTPLLIPQQQAAFQESSILVSMDTFNTQRWFVSKNRISAGTCLPTRFLETSLHVTVSSRMGHPVIWY
jgi:hypothetical protein